ncbi:MAG TPA: hypothetical protein VKJ07_16010, partial [Mycobacteriales bacterium]|nr:hypothetical protein [Mycobacteriales bacterium]
QTVVAVSGGKVNITSGAVSVTDVEGALVLFSSSTVGQPNGVAGFLSGKAAVDVGGFHAGGNVVVRVNKSGAAIDQVISVGDHNLHLFFGDATDTFAVSLLGATITIVNVVTITGDVTITNGVFAGRHLKVFVGTGPAYLDDGTLNPLAQGLLIADGTVGVVQDGSSRYALDVQGDISLVGFSGLTIAGHIHVRVNEQPNPVTQTIPFGDDSGDVSVQFDSSEEPNTTTGAPYVSVAGTGLTISVLGQTITADLDFTRTADGFTITVTHLSLALTDGSSTVASFAQGPSDSGTFTLTSAGVVAALSGTLTLSIPNVAVSGNIKLALNTTSAPATAGSTSLPVGPYWRLSGSTINITVGGVTLHAGTLDVESSADGTTHIAVGDGTFSVGDGSTTFLSLDQIDGDLVTGADGLSGRLSAHVSTNIVPGLTVGTVRLAVNTGAAAVGDLAAGPYLRVELDGAQLSFAGQTLSGDFAFERVSTTDRGTTTTIVRAVVTNLTFAITAGGSPIVSLTNGSGVLETRTGGVAAQLSGTLTVNLPGVHLTGALVLQINTTSVAIDDTIPVGDQTVALSLPTGGGTGFLRFHGTGLTLDLLGQTLTADVDIARSGTTTTLAIANGSLSIGGGLVTVTNGTANVTVDATGMSGSISGSVTFSVPGIAISAG